MRFVELALPGVWPWGGIKVQSAAEVALPVALVVIARELKTG